MLLISVLLFFSSILFSRADDVLVTIPNGKIKGRKEYSLRGISFFAFQQIPFAKPPVGNLRFQDPQPVENWKGTLDASKNKQILCFQQSNMYKIVNMSAVEYEDCLYLNVYTPLNPSSNANLPVLFYIYGGGFVNGASDFDFFGPHYLMESGVIVVTANYRVGAFGKFYSVVWYYYISGLFRAAIAQSGSIISPWAYQRDYKQIAYDVASSLDRNFNRSSDSMQLLTFLRRASAADLNKAANDFKQNTGNEQIIQGFRFTPVVEPDHENAFITEMMYPAIEKGHMNRVPLMMGICSEEAIARAAVANFQSSVVSYENDLSRLVNKNMHLVDANEKKTAGEAIRKIYTNGLLQNDLGKAVRYFSDMSFNRAVIRHAEMQSNYSDVYFYQFSYHGPLGGNRPYLEGAYRVGHAEDNHYLWAYSNHTFLNKYSAEDITASNRFRTLFTNFAKYLNPTPKSEPLFENIIWPKVKPHDFQYLDINETLTIMRNPKGDVYPKWVDLYEKMAVKPFDTY
nr:venom carboxylesterase-6-like [Leptinotarsa decemlineata]